MARTSWHILREEHAVTVARHLPVRLDLCVRARIEAPGRLSLTSLAQQIRQDVWRALQMLRGFSPVVRLCQTGATVDVEAGGRLCAPGAAGGAADKIAEVLDSADNRRRWLTHAGRQA